MKKGILLLVITLMISTAICENIDRIIAKVGRDIILQSELEMRKQQLEATAMLTDETTDHDILNEIIESRLIIQKAKEEDYEVDQLEIKNLAQQQIDQVASQFDSEEEFKQTLKTEMGLTIPGLKDFYIEMFTEQRLRDQIINSSIKSKIHVTDAEIENYYQDNLDIIPIRPELDKIGMIMKEIKPSEKTKKRALKQINRIIDKLNEGEDFSDIVNNLDEYGENLTGGDIGFFGRGRMVKSFERVAFSLRTGEVSEVVETEFGYHIIKMEERRADEVRVSHILREITPSTEDSENINNEMNDLLERLRSGEDFYTLAVEYTDDDSSRANNGVIGEFKQNEYPEMFKSYISELDYNEYSDVVSISDYVYIFAKLQKTESRPYKYNEIYDRIKQMVVSQKEIELYDNWVKELIKDNFVETYLDE